MPKNKEKRALNSYARYSGIAIQMFIIIGAGTYVGVFLDRKYPNEYNGFTITLSLTFVILSIIFVIRRIIAATNK